MPISLSLIKGGETDKRASSAQQPSLQLTFDAHCERLARVSVAIGPQVLHNVVADSCCAHSCTASRVGATQGGWHMACLTLDFEIVADDGCCRSPAPASKHHQAPTAIVASRCHQPTEPPPTADVLGMQARIATRPPPLRPAWWSVSHGWVTGFSWLQRLFPTVPQKPIRSASCWLPTVTKVLVTMLASCSSTSPSCSTDWSWALSTGSATTASLSVAWMM